MKNDVVKFVFAMAITALISALTLSKVYLATSDNIEARALEVQASAKKTIFPLADFFEQDSVGGLIYERVYSNSKLLGYIFTVHAPAYSSVISTMAGVDKNFIIKGIVILSQNETPGLGSRIEEIQSDRYIWQFYKKEDETIQRRPWFQEQFIGLSAVGLRLNKMKEWRDLTETEREQYRLNNTISAISGATISAEVVKKSVKEAATILRDGLYERDSLSVMFEDQENIAAIEQTMDNFLQADSNVIAIEGKNSPLSGEGE